MRVDSMPARTADRFEDAQTTIVDGSKAKMGKPPGSPTKKEERPKAQDVAELKDYQLGDCLGRGAFGSV
jgi:hypothetical protein